MRLSMIVRPVAVLLRWLGGGQSHSRQSAPMGTRYWLPLTRPLDAGSARRNPAAAPNTVVADADDYTIMLRRPSGDE